MSQFVIKMPDIGEGIAEVEIVEWHVNVGDVVVEDQVLADVMTDKASVEIPSSVNGKVVSLGGEVGDILAVGSDLITIDLSSSSSDVSNSVDDSSETDAIDTNVDKPQEIAHPDISIKADVDSVPNNKHAINHQRVMASPSVRKRARELDINLSDVSKNPDAPVSHSDLDNYLLAGTAKGANVAKCVGISDYEHDVSDTTINVVGLRRQISQKMLDAKRTIPHFSYVEEIDVTELENLRANLNKDKAEGTSRLTVLPFLMRAVVLAVRKHPEVNATFDDVAGTITQHGAVHMGMAAQTDKGLMVPVIKNAHALSIWDIGARISTLANSTRQGKVTRENLSGSTITISSLGALGGIVSTPIINKPEVAIVGVNKITDKLVLQHGFPVNRKVMNLSSSFDHRVVDGMEAAKFVQEVRRLLECPALLFIE